MVEQGDMEESGTDTDESARSVKPAVFPKELRQFRNGNPGNRLARLEADAELMRRLTAEGFTGAAWEAVAVALVEYGFTVMRAWVVTGQVFTKLAEKGRPVPSPSGGRVPRDVALPLAEDSVADGIVDFRDRVLSQGKWDPDRGASLTTFFIGNCLLLQFPALYRLWHSESSRGLQRAAAEAAPRRPSNDPARQVVEADSTQRNITAILEPIPRIERSSCFAAMVTASTRSPRRWGLATSQSSRVSIDAARRSDRGSSHEREDGADRKHN